MRGIERAVAAEAARGREPSGAEAEALARALADRIKRELGVTAAVEILAFGALPRTEGKTRRVVRLDQQTTGGTG